MSKYVVLLSGGLDSSALLALLKAQGHDVHTLSVLYGQRHAKEVYAARALALYFGVSHQILHMGHLAFMFTGSALTDERVEMPKGHYTDLSMKATVVPNRNMVLISLATAFAISIKADAVAYAAHAGDHAIYPDCRKAFIEVMRQALLLCDWKAINLVTPFESMTKAEIVKNASLLDSPKFPFHLTWSCYLGGGVHCGECGTCVERKEAFKVSGVPDPTEYLV